ncbi:MAG: radical SAM protein [FCB group bacterium]|nr:radical SAM protein [FCB group bacterium]
MGGTQRTACIFSTGCLSNLLEGTQLEQVLEKSGYSLTTQSKTADLIILNTCAFNQAKEDEAVKLIEKTATGLRNGGRIVVCGCLPKINRDRLRSIHGGITFGPRDMDDLPRFLADLLPVNNSVPGPISYTQYSSLKKTIFHTKRLVDTLPGLNRLPLIRRLTTPLFNYSADVCCIKIATGCTGLCTYCAIKFAKGRCVSRPLMEIEDNKRLAIEQGYSKFILVGDEITAYGSDLSANTDIIDVISLFLEDDRVETLYLESFEPGFMITHRIQVMDILDRGKTPVFCSSVQSGSDRILKLMGRRYEATDYLNGMIEIKRQFPLVYLRNEMIVGFPDETDDDYQKSLHLVDNLRADFINVYEYEDRPHTKASRMPDKIPAEIKKRRRKKLLRQHYKNLFLRKR